MSIREVEFAKKVASARTTIPIVIFDSVLEVVQKIIKNNETIAVKALHAYLSFDRFYIKEDKAVMIFVKAVERCEKAEEYTYPILRALEKFKRSGLAITTIHTIDDDSDLQEISLHS
jgi:hypothetical protein